MKANITASRVQIVPIGAITPYPDNARHGDIEAICLSLKAHGQFRPITVQVGTNYILAGNHTYLAMRKLKYKKVKVVMVDVDEATARKIVLADNRMADKAGYNEPLLKELLGALPDLEGTGFTQTDLDALNAILDTDYKERAEPKEQDPKVKIGMWTFYVEQDSYDAWKAQLQEEVGSKSRHRCVQAIKNRLGFPERPLVIPEATDNQPTETVIEGEESVPINEIIPHPLNPREGDIGAIIESLKSLGQYRPIVVNKRTNHCLVGNHTLQAMAQMGWEKVGVTWVDVDEENEIKIVLVDNRTSDLATYDNHDLNKLLMKVQNLNGTGFTKEEVAEILGGGKTTPRYSPIGRSNVKVGDYTFRAHNENLNEWANAIYKWEDIAELLRFPLSACHLENE